MAYRKSAGYRLRRARRDPAFREKETLEQALRLGFFGNLREILTAASRELGTLRAARLSYHAPGERVLRSRARDIGGLVERIVNVHGVKAA